METTCVFQVKRDVIHVRLIIYRIHNNIERVERCLAMGGDRGKKRVNDRLGFFLISSVLKALQLFLPPPPSLPLIVYTVTRHLYSYMYPYCLKKNYLDTEYAGV